MDIDYNHYEDAYFRKQDAEARRKLRDALNVNAAAADHTGLAQATGITEAQVLESLQKLGVTPEQAQALHLLPLVEVSWADGDVHPRERAAVLHAAARHGITPESPAGQFLAALLETKPSDTLFDGIRRHLAALLAARGLKPATLIDECHAIAAAAGGFFGFGPNIDTDEREAIEALEKSLRPTKNQ